MFKTNGTASPISLSSLNFNMNGTTNINDVSNIRLYYNGQNNHLDTTAATYLGNFAPISGNIVFTGSQTLTSGDNYFFITYDVSNTATEGDVLDAEVNSLIVDGTTQIVNPTSAAGNRTVVLTTALLYKPGDAGSLGYRIPAIATAQDGSLVTAADKRNNGGGVDLSKNGNIDIVIRRSTDNGVTWSPALTIAA